MVSVWGCVSITALPQEFDLSNTNLRLVPQTDALTDQKLEALDNVTAWVYNSICSGEFRENRVGGNVLQFDEEAPKAEVYDIYCSTLRSKYEVPVKEAVFWKSLEAWATYSVMEAIEVQQDIDIEPSKLTI